MKELQNYPDSELLAELIRRHPPVLQVIDEHETSPIIVPPMPKPIPVPEPGLIERLRKSDYCVELDTKGVSRGFDTLSKLDWQDWTRPSRTTYASGMEYLQLDGGEIVQKLRPLGSYSSRTSCAGFLKAADTYTLTQSIMFDPNFDWGGKDEGGKFGFGLGGGSTPTGSEVSESGFTLRPMWRGNRHNDGAHVALYSYAFNRATKWGDDYPLAGFEIERGQWFEFVTQATMNTQAGRADGSARAWIDGELMVEEEGIEWFHRGNPYIDRLMYVAFHGGSGRSWMPSRTNEIRHKNVALAIGRIDP